MQGIKNLFIEKPLIVVLIAAITTLIIVLSSIYFTSLSTLPNITSPSPTPVAYDPNLDKTVIALSEREDYAVSFLKRDNLMAILTRLDFWKKNSTTRLVIALSAKPQKNLYKNSSNEEIFSHSISSENGVTFLRISMNNESIKKTDASEVFGSAVVFALTEASDEKPNKLLTTAEIEGIFKISKALPRSLTHPSTTPPAQK